MKKFECPDFVLGDKITDEQYSFFDKYGVIIFKNFLNSDAVQLYIQELNRIEKQWLDEGRDKVNGIPLNFGKDQNGNRMIQRMCFLSLYSNPLHELLQDRRVQATTGLLYPYEGRIGENEKDGLILNHYVRMPESSFTQMGWHTDSPRDLFLGQKIMPMLNVGIHLDDTPFENGGLRVLPGTHKQGILRLLFGKKILHRQQPRPPRNRFRPESRGPDRS
jgi:ectoine hydroxylase-related dioxygenase (phytanoyl-CoA dioxygenase family)